MPLRKLTKSRPANDPDYVEPLYYKKRKRRDKMSGRTIIIIAGVIIFIAAVGGSYLLVKGNKTTPKTAGHTSSSGKSSIVVPPVTTPAGTPTYTSNGTDLNLTFQYPANWTVSPVSNDNSSDGTITVTTPLGTITDASGISVTSKIVVQVRPGTSTISELSANSPIEAVASTQIAYAAPTANQYTYPYISYFHFSNGSSKTSGVFEEVMITGGQSFTANESLNSSYLSGLDPVISASFYMCSTQACTGSGATPLSINANIWANISIFQQVQTLFESFKLN